MWARSNEALVLRHAAVWGHPECDAVVLRAGRIESIRQSVDVDLPEDVLDLAGCSILPGFIDAHVHLLHTGLRECGWSLDLSGRSRDEVLAAVRDAARNRGRGEWIVAAGWDESDWKKKAHLECSELDRAAPCNPVLAVRVDGHLLVANSCALESRRALAILDAWQERTNRSAGHVREEAAEALLASVKPAPATMWDALRAAARRCHSQGITSVHTMCDSAGPGFYFAAAEGLRLRMVVHPPIRSLEQLRSEGRRSGDGDAWVRFGGLKVFADGSIGAGTAAVSAPPLEGRAAALHYSDEGMEAVVRAADEAGWQTLIHAIGDRAIEQAVRAHESVGTDKALRHRLEHVEFPGEGHIERIRSAGLAVCMQPNFIGNWAGPGGLYEAVLGAERNARGNPLRQVIDQGIPLGFGSDGMPISPLYGISCTVQADNERQRLTLEEAVDAYTIGSGHLSHDEESRGSLDVGMVADLVVLDGPLTGGADEISRRAVERTFVGGECVYTRTEA